MIHSKAPGMDRRVVYHIFIYSIVINFLTYKCFHLMISWLVIFMFWCDLLNYRYKGSGTSFDSSGLPGISVIPFVWCKLCVHTQDIKTKGRNETPLHTEIPGTKVKWNHWIHMPLSTRNNKRLHKYPQRRLMEWSILIQQRSNLKYDNCKPCEETKMQIHISGSQPPQWVVQCKNLGW